MYLSDCVENRIEVSTEYNLFMELLGGEGGEFESILGVGNSLVGGDDDVQPTNFPGSIHLYLATVRTYYVCTNISASAPVLRFLIDTPALDPLRFRPNAAWISQCSLGVCAGLPSCWYPVLTSLRMRSIDGVYTEYKYINCCRFQALSD